MNHELFFAPKDRLYGELEARLSKHIPAPIEILRTKCGKPYIEGNAVYFSLSDCKNMGAGAISKSPVGVDLELVSGRKYQSILKRFSAREQREINSELEFLRHWTAREAYVKMLGEGIFPNFEKLEFYGGELYFRGKKLPINMYFYDDGERIAAVCTQKI